MAHLRESFHSSSPPSDGGADSYKHDGTPDTRLTAFSPLEDSTKSSRLLSALSLSGGKLSGQPIKFKVPGTFHHVTSPTSFESGLNDKDPFVCSTPEKQTKLSATASTFRPLSCPNVSTPVVAYGSCSVSPKPFARDTAIRSTKCPKTGLPLASGLSHTLKLTRSLRISSSSGPVSIAAVEQYLRHLQRYGRAFQGRLNPSIIHGPQAVYVRATNIRDSSRILESSEDKPNDWKIECVSADEINEVCGRKVATRNEGQHDITILPSASRSSEPQIRDKILEHFDNYGVFAIEKQSSMIMGTLRWVLEFDEVDTAWTMDYMKKGWILVEGIFWMTISPRVSDGEIVDSGDCSTASRIPGISDAGAHEMTNGLERMSLADSQSLLQQMGAGLMHSPLTLGSPMHSPRWTMVPWGRFSLHSPQVSSTPYSNLIFRGQTPAPSISSFPIMTPVFPTQSSRTPFSPIRSPGTVMTSMQELPNTRSNQTFHRSEGRRHNAMRINRGQFSPPGPHHNQVDTNKIKEGADVRTTIMLRNIPNKVDQQMLKRIIDESSWGKYDFMYLRIDFANDCNVGYAFINFVDPLDIIDFVNKRANQRWNCFRSDKVAEVSYATIQGKDCLVQKFRNSSVMLEASHYRPKLYYTVNGPAPEMAGQEEAFPEPDNQSKMKRSCENAEHVGLFTPNAGQHFRDEQRRRRSQYDRGTRLAALEECDTFDMYHQELVH